MRLFLNILTLRGRKTIDYKHHHLKKRLLFPLSATFFPFIFGGDLFLFDFFKTLFLFFTRADDAARHPRLNFLPRARCRVPDAPLSLEKEATSGGTYLALLRLARSFFFSLFFEGKKIKGSRLDARGAANRKKGRCLRLFLILLPLFLLLPLSREREKSRKTKTKQK